jgi:hypothetical protein
MGDCEYKSICEKCGYANRKDGIDSKERQIVVSEANAALTSFRIDYCMRGLSDDIGKKPDG